MEDNLDSFLKQQLEFITQKYIAEQMDDVIKKIQQIAKNFAIATKDKKSPFRNVLSVAVSPTSSIEVIKNFIKSQIGRSGASPIWSTKNGNELFAIALIQDIDSLQNDTEQIIKQVRKNINKDNPLNSYTDNPDKQKEMKKRIHLKLVQLYLGYLAREHTALVGEAKFK
ncbi:MAG: hypothetical protein KI793_25025 [Rivularia sp. (in: Bacteria)]|nr:hypothetical protein [Rivularia sp. MS3]